MEINSQIRKFNFKITLRFSFTALIGFNCSLKVYFNTNHLVLPLIFLTTTGMMGTKGNTGMEGEKGGVGDKVINHLGLPFK